MGTLTWLTSHENEHPWEEWRQSRECDEMMSHVFAIKGPKLCRVYMGAE